MTGRPETLEAALAWLAGRSATVSFGPWGLYISVPGIGGMAWGIDNGDIPAAIVEAVGQVFDAVNGKGEA